MPRHDINTQFFPPLDRPVITVSVVWSGASADDIQNNVLALIEPEVRFVDGVSKMTARALEGSGSVSLEFEDGADMQQALSDIETAVNGLTTLPVDSERPVVTRQRFFDSVATMALVGPASEEVKRIWAKRIRDELVALGIDKVTFTGLRPAELQIELSRQDLNRLSMTIGDVSSAIEANARDVPSGLVSGMIERQVRALSDAHTVRALGDMEVRSFGTGEKVLLGDVAEIRNGFDENAERGLSGGDTAIQMRIERAPTADTLKTNALLVDYLEELYPQLPESLSITTYNLAANTLYQRIMLLVENGLTGLAIVVMVLFIFLNGRIAFWVAVGIPVAVLATIAIMMLFGQTINMISLFALIMMLGVIVDDSIVVGEHTYTRLQMGDDPVTAANNGVSTMLMPVSAAMITTLASFGPILLIRDVIGSGDECVADRGCRCSHCQPDRMFLHPANSSCPCLRQTKAGVGPIGVVYAGLILAARSRFFSRSA